MPTRLPDYTTTQRQTVGVTRRAILRLLAPILPAHATPAEPTCFTALPIDIALWWRCGRSAPAL